MSASTVQNTTRLLADLSAGKRSAADELLPLVYDELRAIAAGYFRRERDDHTLQPTALVHEAYLRLVQQEKSDWKNRAHFFAVAARAMRNVLVNHALARKAEKRGGGRATIQIDTDTAPTHIREVDPLDLDDAVKRLHDLDQRKARVVELRFFGGLSADEVSHVLEVSLSTVEADWRLAKAWLSKELAPA